MAQECRRLIDELFARRLGLGLTQEAVADRMGVHRSYVSALELGRRVPGSSILVRYAHAVRLRITFTTEYVD